MIKNKLDEIRLIICGLMFAAISYIAPIDTKEGQSTLDICWQWQDRMESMIPRNNMWCD